MRVWILSLLALATILFGIYEAYEWHGKPFPGFFVMGNQEVGAFHSAAWEAGKPLRYHDKILKYQKNSQGVLVQLQRQEKTWTLELPILRLEGRDYFTIAILPLICALFYLLAGLILYRYHLGLPHRNLLLYFNLFLSIYLATIFDFHTSHFLSPLFLLSFVCLSLLIYQLAFLFPAPLQAEDNTRPYRWSFSLLSIGIGVPYLVLFFTQSPAWRYWEYALIALTALGYLLWVFRLYQLQRRPVSPLIRNLARYLFWGNILAFSIPLLAGMALIVSEQSLPLNYVIPFTLLFPFSMILATLLALLADSRARLIQSEKMASLGSLVGGMAHELNNPLNLIAANVETLKDYLGFLKTIPLPKQKKYRDTLTGEQILAELQTMAEDMDHGMQRAQEMMDLLKDMARGEEAPVELFQIKPVIKESLKFLKERYPNLPTWVSVEVPSGSQLKVSRTLFLEVLMNLVDNAAAALPEHPPDQSIRICFRREGAWAHLGILDRGSGIAPKNLARVKDPLFTTKAPGAGTGLGLAMVERWVRRWGGVLEIHSQLGQGTEVWIRIPQ